MADKELYHMLRNEQLEQFNQKVEGFRDFDLRDVNLRGRNLQHANLKYADLRGAYLSHCNMKGLDLTCAKLEGASMHMARISGVYFPKAIHPQEIVNSVNLGTRIRTADAEDPHASHGLLV